VGVRISVKTDRLSRVLQFRPVKPESLRSARNSVDYSRNTVDRSEHIPSSMIRTSSFDIPPRRDDRQYPNLSHSPSYRHTPPDTVPHSHSSPIIRSPSLSLRSSQEKRYSWGSDSASTEAQKVSTFLPKIKSLLDNLTNKKTIIL